ncbi:MAG TPA: hypothetical protein VIY90_18580 [Steroidobacteraceae bacterium]
MRHPETHPQLPWLVSLGHSLWPFWLFKDANQGDLFARAAARAHNRRMSDVLPRYLRRWLLVCAIGVACLCANDPTGPAVGRFDIHAFLAACAGLVCAFGICALLAISYAWCYLRLGRR